MVALVPFRKRQESSLFFSYSFHSLSLPQTCDHTAEDRCLQARRGSHQYLAFLIIPDLELSDSGTVRHACTWFEASLWCLFQQLELSLATSPSILLPTLASLPFSIDLTLWARMTFRKTISKMVQHRVLPDTATSSSHSNKLLGGFLEISHIFTTLKHLHMLLLFSERPPLFPA